MKRALAVVVLGWWAWAGATGGAVRAAAKDVQPPASAECRYDRPVKPGDAGPNRLAVDLPLLAGAAPFAVVARQSGIDETVAVAEGGLDDLRLFDGEGREVPYLLVQPPPRTPEWVTGRLLDVAATRKTSGFEVELPGARTVDRLALAGLPAPYLKRARLEGSGDRTHWTLLAGETTLFDLPEDHLTRQEIDFVAGDYRYLRLTWDDASSARAPMPRAARARLVGSGSPAAVLRAAVPFERRASEPRTSRYRLTLPAPRLPLVALELAVDGGYVLREARVNESRLSGSEMTPVTLGRSVLRRAVRDDLAAAELRIPIDAPQESQLELVVEDGSNAPLQLTGVTAVFAELPWIYFEATSTRPLRARFGATGVHAPRYDLEAARPSVGKGRVIEASWGERTSREPAAATTPAADVPTTGAPVAAAGFGYRRPIPPGPPGLTALRLDAAALAHSRFSDLRIVTPDDRQVGYLVERLDEPLAIELPALERGPGPALPQATGAQSAYRMSLPEDGLSNARLVLETTARVFDRTVRIVAERDDPRGRNGKSVDVLAEATWRHAEPETPAPPLSLSFSSPLPRALWLVVDEGDNSPLALGRPRLLLPAYRLRFFRAGDQQLSLLYGQPALAAPRYDIALLAPRLVGASAHEVWPEPEHGAAGGGGGAVTATRLFWAALVAAVLVLGVLLARLLKPERPSPKA
jgi:hypothetical protein